MTRNKQAAHQLVEEPDPTDQAHADRWEPILLNCLRLAAVLCFAGWTWVHSYWEAPYGVLLWQDSTFNLASRFGITWDDFVGTSAEDGVVQKWLSRLWWLYLAFTIMSLTATKSSWTQMIALIFGSGMLTWLSYAKYVSAQRQLPTFIEHGSQMLIPILLVMALAMGARHRCTVGVAMVATVLTFAGHGLYATGIWPTPGNFYAMTTLILGVEYQTAQTLLRIVGTLDFVVCLGLFVPMLRRAIAAYATVWGFLTAVARPVAGMSWGLNYWGADQFLHEAIFRSPHFLIPLYLLLLWRQQRLDALLDRSTNE